MKKLFTILALLMAFTVSGVAQKTVYLKPNSNWLESDARFAVYMFTSEENAWTDFSAMGESGIYSATIPAEYADGKIILVRMNGATTENNWGNKWNQSPDITTVNDNAFYIITGWDTYRESSIPSLAGTPIWSSGAPVAVVNWNGPITISAEKFSNAKVGDIIHVGVEGVTTTADWDAQVSIRNGQTWGDLEQDFPVGNGTVEDASFVITGDMLGILKENGLLLTGKQYVSRLVTLESVEGTYSDKAIWIGNKTGSFTVNKNHLINANIEAGNVIRVTATPTQGHSGDSWLTMQYDNNGWNDFENASSFQTSTGYELLLTDDMCNKLRDYNLVINENGYTVTQVEIISESAINQIESVQVLGDWNAWSGEAGALTKVEGSNTWKGTIDLSNICSDQEFKVAIDFTNMDGVYWYGRRQMPIADDGTADVVTIQTENDNVWDNFVLKNETSGYQTYDVTLTWNDSACPYAGWTLSLVGKDARQFEYYIMKSDGTWSKGDKMTENNGVYTATISDWAGKYFAIAPHTALDASDNLTWSRVITPTSSDDFVVNFANYSDETTTGGKVWKIDASNTADVTINFTPAENKFEITNAEEFTIGQYGYSTYSRAQKYQVEGASVSFVTVSGSEATLVAVDAEKVLPAMEGAGKHAGVIIAGEAGAKAIIKSVYADAEAVDASANLLAGTGDNSYEVGTQFADGDTYTAYILAKPADKNLGFYLLDDSDRTIAAHKAFLAVPGESQAPFFGFGGNDTTGINGVDRGALSVEGCYTLDGRRVEQPTKGLYIMNGKKVLVK